MSAVFSFHTLHTHSGLFENTLGPLDTISPEIRVFHKPFNWTTTSSSFCLLLFLPFSFIHDCESKPKSGYCYIEKYSVGSRPELPEKKQEFSKIRVSTFCKIYLMQHQVTLSLSERIKLVSRGPAVHSFQLNILNSL